MKNLFKWLQNNGYTYEKKTAHENYFYNVPELTQEAATIEICSENIKEVNAKIKKLEAYLTRYNYQVYINARLHCDVFGVYHKFYYVTSDKNAAVLENYRFFADAARTECELLQHEYYAAGRHNEVNAAMREIMDKYGAMYNRSFLHILAA